MEEIKGERGQFEIVKLEKKRNERDGRSGKNGFLVEFLRGSELGRGLKKFAQIYVATMPPGSVRGNHYHKKKLEWFTIFNGKVRVVLEDTKTKKRKSFMLDDSEKSLRRVCIKSGVAHAFKNVSNSTAVLVAYANKTYDPKNPDTYEYEICD